MKPREASPYTRSSNAYSHSGSCTLRAGAETFRTRLACLQAAAPSVRCVAPSLALCARDEHTAVSFRCPACFLASVEFPLGGGVPCGEVFRGELE